ncbi:MAG: hypothetical protein HY689_14315 [Chloroflexi bacterium]|nr:hypothetical protein [Chloroflexota bacterium]
MKVGIVLVLVGLALLAGGCAGMTQPVTVALREAGNSGVSGTATFRPAWASTRVEIQVKGGEGYEFLVAHIHSGTCAAMNPFVQYQLPRIVGGRVSTLIPGDIGTLFQGDALALTIHPPSEDLPATLTTPRSSVHEIESTLACGELRE